MKGAGAGRSLERVVHPLWRTMGTEVKLFLLKLKGPMAWGQRAVWPQCASAGSLLLCAPGCSRTQGSAAACGSIKPFTPSKEYEAALGRKCDSPAPSQATGPLRARTGSTPGPRAGCSRPRVTLRVSLLSGPQPLNFTELLSNSST